LTRQSMQPISLRREMSSQGASQESRLYETPDTRKSGNKRRKITPSQSSRQTATASNTRAHQARKSLLSDAVEPATQENINMEFALIDIPRDFDSENPDYTNSLEVYERYWAECTDSYMWGIEKSYPISIDQLETPPADLNVRSMEDKLVESILHYLVEMPDKDKKLTLCAMPKGLSEKPKSWEDIQNGQFWMINGQHSVEASKRMRGRPGISTKVLKKFQTWDCFIVWNDDHSILRKISAFYNRVNHFQQFKPTWATNIIGAREVWKSLNSPKPLKEATEVGRSVTARRSKKQMEDAQKYNVSS
jgi:hypothetical protein